MLNRVVLMGRLVADPELRHTANNVAVTTFRIAVDRNYTPKGAERQTDFINIVTWRNTAEFVSRYFRKGQLVALEGSIQTRSYTDNQGNNRTAFEVVADQVYFAESRNSSSQNGNQSSLLPRRLLKSRQKAPASRWEILVISKRLTPMMENCRSDLFRHLTA